LLTAHLLVNGEDCLAYVDYLAVLNHEELRGLINLGSVQLLSGSRRKVGRELSRIGFTDIDIRSPSTELLELLRRLAVARTPVLLILGRDGNLFLAVSLPSTARGRVYLAQCLVAITRLAQSEAKGG
jgi:hypothetical protein